MSDFSYPESDGSKVLRGVSALGLDSGAATRPARICRGAETAAAYAEAQVAKVRGDPQARLDLLPQLYQVPVELDRGYLRYRRATAFMGWQLRPGLKPDSHAQPGSRWWRMLNESLLLDTSEASALAFGLPGQPPTLGATATLEFIRAPSARSWYRAHNLTISTAYLAHGDLARQESLVERFFINLVLVPVLFAHAMVAAQGSE